MLGEKFLQFSNLGAEWVLWLLVGLSVISIAIILEKLIFFFSRRENLDRIEPKISSALRENKFEDALKELNGEGLLKDVLRSGIELMKNDTKSTVHIEKAMKGCLMRQRNKYEARLTPLGTIGNNAPFVGLFGTVIGIINAFFNLGTMEMNSQAGNQMLMAAISEALVATGVGILVAIPAVAAYNFAKSYISKKIRETESMMEIALSIFSENISLNDKAE